jgi:predicted HTH domain antitoxin
MNTTTDLIVPKEFLDSAKMTGDEMRIDLAVHLYATKRLSIGKARRLAELDLISFQKELAKRDVCINYDVEDLHDDMRSLGLELKK